MPSGTGQSPSTTVAFQVDPDDVVRAELVPGDQPRIAQQRPVADVAGDVAGQMIVVPLVPQAAGQEHQLLPR